MQSLIDQYFQSESVEYKCDKTTNCPGNLAKKKMQLISPINAVIVLLKRNTSIKNHQPVSFNNEHYFEVWDFDTLGSKIYKKPLISVVCHLGTSVHSGHYIAYVRHPKSGSWYKYDDENVTPVPWSDVKSKTKEVYMLFFGPGAEKQNKQPRETKRYVCSCVLIMFIAS